MTLTEEFLDEYVVVDADAVLVEDELVRAKEEVEVVLWTDDEDLVDDGTEVDAGAVLAEDDADVVRIDDELVRAKEEVVV